MTSYSPNFRGAIFMMIAMAGYVGNDAFMKLTLVNINLYQSILIRGIILCAILAVIAWKQDQLSDLKRIQSVLRDPLVLTRTLAEVIATAFFLTGLMHMEIANATAIMQLISLTVTLGAAFIFHETVGWRRFCAVICGFIGVLFIVRPVGSGFNAYSLLILVAVVLISVRELATRRISSDIPTLLVSLVAGIGVAMLGAIGCLFETWQPVSTVEMMNLSGAAVLLVFGYVFSFTAMRVGDISFTSPFRYSVLLWAILIGIFVFGEYPDFWSLIGAAILVASGMYTFYRERVVAKKTKTTVNIV